MKPEDVIPYGMMRCYSCEKDRSSFWQPGAGNSAMPPQGPRCECGSTQFLMTIGQQPVDLPEVAHHVGNGYSILTCPYCIRTIHFIYKESL